MKKNLPDSSKKTVTGKKPIEIVPSILSVDLADLGKAAIEAEEAGAKAIQIDVMDGRFVDNTKFGPDVVAMLRPLVKIVLDVHLMIVEPGRHLEAFKKAGADRLIVHQETCDDLNSVLQSIHELGAQAGVAIKPATPLSAIEEILDRADVIQIMTVEPGKSGQKFLKSQLVKIRHLKQKLNHRGLDIAIAVDGGINTATAPRAVKAGATILVAGTSVYNSKGSVTDNLAALRKSFQPYEKE